MKLSIYELLGVEEEEAFKLNGAEYKIIDGKSFGKSPDGTWQKMILGINLLHEAEFERLPFVPKPCETYYTIDSILTAVIKINNLCSDDFLRMEYGLCYRTKAQAEQEGIPKMKALMEKWGGKCE